MESEQLAAKVMDQLKDKNTKTKDKPKNRRGLRRNNKKHCIRKLSLIGVNSAGLSSKLASFDSMMHALQPTVFFIEETKEK